MNENPTAIQLLKRAAYCLSSDETQVANYNLALEIEKHLDSLQENSEFPSLGEEVIFLRKENQRLTEKCNHLTKELLNIDRISEFGAEYLKITTEPTIGLKRWADKQYMVSFFPTDIKGNRLQFQSGIDKVYDLFLTEEQVEAIVEEYNRRNNNV